MSDREASRVRPEIQALRAVAVLLVVFFHLWPEVLHGGFIGVDVFFVISGFLITGHLMRERASTGRIALGQFWARRARRLLPAALLVLLVSAVAVVVWLPRIFWSQFFAESIASALYVENWLLAANSVDYLAADRAASAAQHYWSLSVEEQFYIVWPLLILAAFGVARLVRRPQSVKPVVILLGVVVAGSLVTSVVMTAVIPSVAYFATPVRAWEFGAGGLLALLPSATRLRHLRTGVAWAGWALIAASAWFISSALPFPGVVAVIPVVATVMVIWAATPGTRWAPDRIVGLRPVTWVGNVSYSAYLWHWPLIVLAPYILGYAQLALLEKSAILAITLVLAGLSRRWIEEPVRRLPSLTRHRARRTLLAALAAMVLVLVPSLAAGAAVRAQVAQDDHVRAELSTTPCFGAGSLDPHQDCSAAVYPVLSPDPALAPEDNPGIYVTDPPCFAADEHVVSCRFGDGQSEVRVALIGDSHAAQWEPALRALAEQRGWDLRLYLKTNCVVTAAARSAAYQGCAHWSDGVVTQLDTDGPFNLVITSFFAENIALEVDAGVLDPSDVIDGFHTVWAPLIADGATVVAIRDTPHMKKSTTVCVALHGDSAQCAEPRSAALARGDLQFDAAGSLPGAAGLDMSDWFCTDDLCPAVIGGVAVHTDPYHITKTYSATLSPYLLAGLRDAVEGVPGADGARMALG